MTIVEMIVNMDCHGCERKVRKALRNMNGVESIDIDMNMQKVTVSGWIDQEKVLRKVRRTGKKAELWPFPNNPEVIGYTQEYADMYTYHSDPATYFHVEQPADISTYNYYEHGSNGQQHVTYQHLPYSTAVGERATIAFSDENVNACSIM
ncbi:heavy metal-associated isoprenylated plant protein 28-like [Cynara cardunculus var. scolymus]|uniref:heavy metal-associated isoprenylated plant protein 28-like n=1 Tax=Cynara cardunculus var. scolymus TaxID=59895 RepID=UPI000D62E2C7|nr:heavy metal-associated isoprenylated plant protein 28-like [Cynara cardunculus var. scolymus]